MKSGYFFINENILPCLFAISQEEQTRGLMNVEAPVPNMLFINKIAKINKFWMKDTPSELDIIFCKNGKIVEICRGEPNSTKIVGPDSLTDLVIELPYGTAKSLNISPGDSVGVIK